jgi:hypothetical protein
MWREKKNEDVRSYWMTLNDRIVETEREVALEEATDL